MPTEGASLPESVIHDAYAGMKFHDPAPIHGAGLPKAMLQVLTRELIMTLLPVPHQHCLPANSTSELMAGQRKMMIFIAIPAFTS